MCFWTFWWFSGWISTKLALIWSKRYLQHDSLHFLPLASSFMTFWLGHAQKSKLWDFWTRKWPTSLGFSIFETFFAFPFSPFLSFLLQWLAFYWACLQLKNFSKSLIETGNFYHGVARCSDRKGCSEFFTQTTFWAFLWWRQKSKKGQCSSQPVWHRSQWVK